MRDWRSTAGHVWRPQDLGGKLLEWWSPRFGYTIATGVSALVGVNGIPASQVTGSKQPTRNATGSNNGRPCLTFDGLSHILQATFTLAQPQQVYIVAKYTNAWAATDDLFCGNNSGGTGNVMRMYRAATTNMHLHGGTDIGGTVVDTTQWHLYSATYSGASSGLKQEGTSKFTGDAGAGSASGLSLGASWFFGTAANFANVSVADVAITNAVLTAFEETQLTAFLRRESGL